MLPDHLRRPGHHRRHPRSIRNSGLRHVRLSSPLPARGRGELAKNRIRAHAPFAEIVAHDREHRVLPILERRAEDTDPASHLVAQRVPGWRAIKFNLQSRMVCLPWGVELDLGATAKALASDLAAGAASEAIGRGGVLVSLGGDIAVAGDARPEGWPIQASEDSGAEPCTLGFIQ